MIYQNYDYDGIKRKTILYNSKKNAIYLNSNDIKKQMSFLKIDLDNDIKSVANDLFESYGIKTAYV